MIWHSLTSEDRSTPPPPSGRLCDCLCARISAKDCPEVTDLDSDTLMQLLAVLPCPGCVQFLFRSYHHLPLMQLFFGWVSCLDSISMTEATAFCWALCRGAACQILSHQVATNAQSCIASKSQSLLKLQTISGSPFPRSVRKSFGGYFPRSTFCVCFL